MLTAESRRRPESRSGREPRQAGTSPKESAETNTSERAYIQTRGPNENSKWIGITVEGVSPGRRFISTLAPASPSAAASRESTALSTIHSRTRRAREAPNACRMAVSWRRSSARASRIPATLAQATASRIPSRKNGGFVAAFLSAGQQDTGHIGASHREQNTEQEDAYGGEGDAASLSIHQGSPGVAGQVLVGLGPLLRHFAANALHFDCCLCEWNAGPQSRVQGSVTAVVAPLRPSAETRLELEQSLHRNPQIGSDDDDSLPHAAKTGSRDAINGEGLAVDQQGPADDVAPAFELAHPEAVTDDKAGAVLQEARPQRNGNA